MGSFAVALFLFGILSIVRGAFGAMREVAGADRLIVTNRISPIPFQPLPVSYRDRILRIPGVNLATPVWIAPGFYQDDRIFFMATPVEVETHRAVYPEFMILDDQWAAFTADREGCAVGERLAQRFNWKVGDRVPIRLPMSGGKAWEFNIRTIFRGRRPEHETNQFWYQMRYL